MLEITNMTLKHGQRVAVCQTTMKLTGGQVVALIGVNGSGKSTFLHGCAGLHPLATGSVQWMGCDVTTMNFISRARAIAFVAQRPSLAADFTVRELVTLGRHAGGSDDARVQSAMEDVGIREMAERPFAELSMGERQRAVLARALAQHERGGLLVLDEPFSAMDPSASLHCARLLGEVAARGGTVLMAIHDLPLADACADSVCWLRGGVILAHGATAEVLDPVALGAAFGCEFLRTNGSLALMYPRRP